MLTVSEDLHALVTYATGGRPLFFVGSGISIPYPACLPSAREMIDLFVGELRPDVATEKEVAAIREALPELFYEGLSGLIGETAVLPWIVLALHKSQPHAFRTPIKPTLGHLVITYLSWKNALPIVTTNFDPLFESAARVLGLDPVISLPNSATWRCAEGRVEVAIWQVHGSADNPDSICTTLRQISTLNTSLLSELRNLCSSNLPCLMGYSGCDIDLFPYLASFPYPASQPGFWLCDTFPSWHGIHARPGRFRAICGLIDDFASCVIPMLKAGARPPDPGTLDRLLEWAEGNPTPEQAWEDAAANRRVYLEAARQIIQQSILPRLGGTDGEHRLLLHAISLATVQRFDWSARHAENYVHAIASETEPLWDAKAWNLLSSCYHNLSKYGRSEHAARRSLSLSRENRCTDEAVYALANLDEAQRMQLDLPLRLGVPRFLPKIFYLVLVLRFVFDSFRLARWTTSITLQQGDARQDAVGSVLIEHRVRLWSMLQSLAIAVVGRRVASRFFGRLWRRLRGASGKIGYAAGIANAMKYLDRVHSKTPEGQVRGDDYDELGILSSREVYVRIAHKVGLALILRDEADFLAEVGRTNEAADKYEQAVHLARESGNLSLELKALLALHAIGKTVDARRIEELANNVEVYWPNAVRTAIMRRVTG